MWIGLSWGHIGRRFRRGILFENPVDWERDGAIDEGDLVFADRSVGSHSCLKSVGMAEAKKNLESAVLSGCGSF
jgi:hypothetical protein